MTKGAWLVEFVKGSLGIQRRIPLLERSCLMASYVIRLLARGTARVWCLAALALAIIGAALEVSPVSPLALLAVALALISLALSKRFHALHRRKPRIVALAPVLVVAAGAVGVVAWTVLFDSMQGSDFGIYYRCGSEPRASISEWVRSCASAYIGQGGQYWTRSLFYTAPLGSWLKENYPLLKAANAAAHILTLGLFVAVVRSRIRRNACRNRWHPVADLPRMVVHPHACDD